LLRLVAAWVALFVCAAAPGSADDVGDRIFDSGVPVEISADSLEYESARDLYVARGSVKIRQGGRELSADWMAFSRRSRRGVASGSVLYTDGTDTVHTSFVEFDIDTLHGVMFDAEFEVPSDHFEMRGAEIRKTGDRTYSFRDGEFTTCHCPDPDAREPWQLTAEKADLEVEGYGKARNTTVEILGVPILWLPWMIYPLKTKRQSGLLFPDLTLSGRNGVEVGLPIFWAAGDPVNVIFTPRWLQKRGFKGDLGIGYVLGERSSGGLFGSFIYDQDVEEDSLETPFEKERWATRGVHDLFLPFGWRFQTQYAFASDNAHPDDFDDLRDYRWDRFLPAGAFATKPLGRAGAFGFVAGARFVEDRQNPDDTDRDDFLLQRLPEARFDALPAALPFASWIAPALDVRYAWYQQDDLPQDAYGSALLVDGRFLDTGVDGLPTSVEQGRDGQGTDTNPDPNFDDFGVGNPTGTEDDAVFQEGELLADSGHRVLLRPRLGLPLRLADAVELYPEVGWNETLYQSDAQGFERRGFLTGRVDLRTRLRRRFGAVTHLLEPRLGWALVTETSQSHNPLYVPDTAVPQRRIRELGLDNVTRDTADRIREFNGLSFALGNRFFRRGGEAGGPVRVLGDFVLSGLYDFEEGGFGNVYLDGRAYPIANATARFNVGFDPDDVQVDEGLADIAWHDERGDRISFGYRYLRDIPEFFEAFPEQNDRFESFRSDFAHINQINGGFRLAFTEQWGITYRVAYSFERSLFLGNEGGLEFLSRCRCWAVRLELRENRSRGVEINLSYTLVGLGDDARNPFASGGSARAFGFLDAPGGV
jgi:lipopolysaccharide assembly outer membrane protein LptD (OstA)